MTFLEKIKMPFFWKRASMIIVPFFIVLVIISLLFNSFSAIIEADMATVLDQNFNQGKWKRFFFTKAFVAFLYGVWITSRNVK